jgi:hypothetical protein
MADLCRDIGSNGNKCDQKAYENGYCMFHVSMHELIREADEMICNNIEMKLSGTKRKLVSITHGCSKRTTPK